MGAPRTTPKVLEALSRHRGLDVPLAELMLETGLTKSQVVSAVHRLIVRDNLPITVVSRANMWRYEFANGATKEIPKQRKAEPEDTCFEVVGRTKSGEPIVRGDVTDTLYRVTALEF